MTPTLFASAVSCLGIFVFSILTLRGTQRIKRDLDEANNGK